MIPKKWYIIINILIEFDWLNMLVERGENKGYAIQAGQI
jgi:hypothetical protein